MNAERLGCISPWCRLLVLACSVIALMGLPPSNVAAHTQDKDCADFATQRAAQDHQDTHTGDPDRLNDDNGVTCPQLPCPCGATPLAPAAPIAERAPSSAPLGPLTIPARVSRVVDGDTLKVRLPTGQMATVGLIGVDSPKRGKPGSRGECGAVQATAQMKRLVLRNASGRSVTLQTDPMHTGEARSERLRVYVSARGVDLGRTMIASGAAKVAVFESAFMRLPTYRKAQASAKAARRGLWRTCGDSAFAR
jgi:endonuclease YncB( thermonuclease family)